MDNGKKGQNQRERERIEKKVELLKLRKTHKNKVVQCDFKRIVFC